jgi:hypothetical protein
MITARHITPATSATISIHQTAKLAIATDSLLEAPLGN